MFQKVGNRKVVSDDGYSIEFVGLNDLIYREQEKSLRFYVEDWKPKADILLDATVVLRDTGTPLDEVRRAGKPDYRPFGYYEELFRFSDLPRHNSP